jgi:transcriptional regulator with XRE-family HTH domain
MITSAQSRAARGLVDFTQQKLADAAKLDVEAVRQFEAGLAQPGSATADAIQHALEGMGVTFIPEDGDGAGVRLAKQKPDAIAGEDLNASNDE